MMTKRLEELNARVQRLSSDAQVHLMDDIEDLIEQEEWHTLISDPRSDVVLDNLLKEAQQSQKYPCQ